MEEKTFHIGLCLAGAVSAGAYTAGVLDYLFEALDEWESRRGQPDIPTHKIKISVIGGASAGAMTGIITAASVNRPFNPVKQWNQRNLFQKQEQNPFYHSWVDLTADDIFPVMLDTGDIKRGKMFSGLNSNLINTVANRMVQKNAGEWLNRPYIENNLKVFATLTNLGGLDCDITFKADNPTVNKYFVSRHNDYACFVLNKEEAEYQNDGWIPLNFKTNTNLDIARNAAMATGAFPVGLRARPVTRAKKYVNDLEWLRPLTSKDPVDVDPYTTLNVDGGMINNEPFDKVRDVLCDLTGQKEPEEYQQYATSKSTILMVDPFPSELEKFDPKADTLFAVMGGTLSAMLGQLRTKPDNLIKAMTSSMAGQYLIAPNRKIHHKNGTVKEVQGSKAIASGCLGGFGGFLNKEFRIHDYHLGRANCEKFLRDHFTIPVNGNNPIFTEGYESVINKTPYLSRTDSEPSLQIIPVFTEEAPKMPMPQFSSGNNWPSIHTSSIERFRPLIKKRVETALLNMEKFDLTTKFLLWVGAKVVLNKKISDAMMDKIEGSLNDHNLLL